MSTPISATARHPDKRAQAKSGDRAPDDPGAAAEEPQTAAEPEGWRERKKQATRRAIKRAALDLALEHGLGSLTVDGISEAAGVSPRTFFNYFGCKEDALVEESPHVVNVLRERILEHPPDVPALQTLRDVMLSGLLPIDADQRAETLARRRLVQENPSLLPRQMAAYAAIERTMADALAQRLGRDPEEDMEPALLAAMGVAAARVAMRRWATDGAQEPQETIETAFAILEDSS